MRSTKTMDLDWSHSESAMVTTQRLHCDQTQIPFPAKGVVCKTRCHPPHKCTSLELAIFLHTYNGSLSFIARCTLELQKVAIDILISQIPTLPHYGLVGGSLVPKTHPSWSLCEGWCLGMRLGRGGGA